MLDYLGKTIKKGQTVIIPCFNQYRERPFFTTCIVKKTYQKKGKDMFDLEETTGTGKLTLEECTGDILIIKEGK